MRSHGATLSLSCACGELRGELRGHTRARSNRVLCYCRDCRAFVGDFLSRPDLLDAFGGTDIFQVALGQVAIRAGGRAFACARLSGRGLHRFYAACCKTPWGNAVSIRGSGRWARSDVEDPRASHAIALF
jgi:hypothetical protein